MAQIRVERSFAAPPRAVFGWLADPRHYTESTSCLWVRRTVMGDDEPDGERSVRHLVLLGAWFKEQVTTYEPPWYFEYRILASVPKLDHRGARVLVEADGEGARVTWTSSYTVPWWSGGALADKVSEAALSRGFQSILLACARATTRTSAT